ncbi:MAG: NADPH-dependent oxidoreductase [Burkholderiaceae bacterium]|nr:NADPH-dependent oxidoreductase [Burkholderiaceae bacterium]
MNSLLSALSTRYGASASADDMTPALRAAAANPVIESLLGHRSVRAFLPDPVAESALALMVAAAQSAATSSNLQAWSVIAVQDAERKARLATLVGGQAHVRECPLLLVWIADLSRLDRVGVLTGVPARANDYLEMFLVATVDAALAAQNAVVAAESLGLGTVYIGAMRNHPEAVATELGLPDHAFAVFGLCVGRADPARPASVKPRLDSTVVLHHEQYEGVAARAAAHAPEGAEREAIARYDRVMRDFQASQAMPATDWSAQASSRVKGPETLSGRDRLKTALAALGFPLA